MDPTSVPSLSQWVETEKTRGGTPQDSPLSWRCQNQDLGFPAHLAGTLGRKALPLAGNLEQGPHPLAVTLDVIRLHRAGTLDRTAPPLDAAPEARTIVTRAGTGLHTTRNPLAMVSHRSVSSTRSTGTGRGLNPMKS